MSIWFSADGWSFFSGSRFWVCWRIFSLRLEVYDSSFGQPSVVETNAFNAFRPGYIPYETIADANALAHIIVDDPNIGKYTESLHNDRALFRPRIDEWLPDFHCD
jgi:hypothetical protein